MTVPCSQAHAPREVPMRGYHSYGKTRAEQLWGLRLQCIGAGSTGHTTLEAPALMPGSTSCRAQSRDLSRPGRPPERVETRSLAQYRSNKAMMPDPEGWVP